jgi:hypothetical protein
LLDPASGRYRVVDLDDLALVHRLGVVDDALLHRILECAQSLLDSFEEGFPPPELATLAAAQSQLDWLPNIPMTSRPSV